MDADTPHGSPVRLEPWSEDDFELLRAMNAPELMEHLGGPETEEALVKRHRRYVDLSAERTGAGRMFRIVLLPEEVAVGGIGFWQQTLDGEPVYETGWTVLPGFQGRGVASAATRAVAELARAERTHRFLHAFPSTGNGPSNAVCRKAGFELLGPRELEYPPGTPLSCNDWRLELHTGGQALEG
ncbi:GNAT family N-acetyltransferase [Streptomyces sp. Je 1-79]|uniref:GNAT family N-acetyltransferase n=1 Tax=Streptomyces sp. Je 1-79 TaxID=2943847 RepID=UPI0021A8890E|nr:GNAT family N-acetyltransferase [Streptomyces sp. Je 1-79]MCT4356394.1 GNAT family N-acetyltransferase [Streptomyces sp. Je 1-79]